MHLDYVAASWISVGAASDSGFTAAVEGREATKAERIEVLLIYTRGQPPEWRVERMRGTSK